MSISFSTYDLAYECPDKEKIKIWISECIENQGFKIGEINYIFTSDKYIQEINKQFLQHNDTTDIITFDYSTRNKISGDILISIPTVSVNAEFYHVPFFNELLRVIVHGILHLFGYNDSSHEEKIKMRQAEDIALLFYETN
ncbi:MAG: rRNA maturation RNase YbeY, partial [bacterium]